MCRYELLSQDSGMASIFDRNHGRIGMIYAKDISAAQAWVRVRNILDRIKSERDAGETCGRLAISRVLNGGA